ncbi:hypothetical protein MUG78_02900 [Gordonia alkaliphila]|uniref:hypothetical protein n=1 Tax=Gordonia alkaliphila TaxID=1053547 RepID=UPI001FF1648A|nr:hypothetical protein [Gordonia alkaliphila]MCK0438437.1 hypothetical protein [Gordonia alkaliphila]
MTGTTETATGEKAAREQSTRLTAAREAYAAAERAEREARIEAAPGLRRVARRRRAGLRLLMIAALVVAVALVAAAVWASVDRTSAQETLNRDAAVRTAATEAIEVMLSADPRAADEYVDRVLALSTGAQHDRLSKARDDLRAAVAGLGAPSTGRVISAGVQPESGDTVPVLVVAQATAPELVGGAPGTDRVAVRVLMTRSGDRWLVQDTERAS